MKEFQKIEKGITSLNISFNVKGYTCTGFGGQQW